MGRLKVILLFDPSHLIQLVVFIEHLIFKNFILILLKVNNKEKNIKPAREKKDSNLQRNPH